MLMMGECMVVLVRVIVSEMVLRFGASVVHHTVIVIVDLAVLVRLVIVAVIRRIIVVHVVIILIVVEILLRATVHAMLFLVLVHEFWGWDFRGFWV